MSALEMNKGVGDAFFVSINDCFAEIVQGLLGR